MLRRSIIGVFRFFFKKHNGTGDIWGTKVRNKRVFFVDELASSKLNLHGGSFRKYGHLGLFEAKHTCHSWAS